MKITTLTDVIERFVAGIRRLIEASPHTYKKWFRVRLDDFGYDCAPKWWLAGLCLKNDQ